MMSELDKILVAALTLIFMLGMGASLTTEDYARALRRPRAVLVGLLSQYGWMPLLAHFAIQQLGLTGTDALGLLLIACASGGNASNMFTYFSRADLALSITMTAVSTLASVVLMPVFLFVYASSLSETPMQVPYLAVMGTLLAMLVPIGIGMWIRHRSVERARKVERVGSISGAVLLAVLLVTSVADQIELVTTATDSTIRACVGVVSAGMFLGYVVARIVRLDPPQRHAVSLETGVQNSPLAIAVILATFPAADQDALLKVPFLYAMTAILIGTIATFIYRRFPDL
jgi:BASS family bile acid:Na+ symporter